MQIKLKVYRRQHNLVAGVVYTQHFSGLGGNIYNQIVGIHMDTNSDPCISIRSRTRPNVLI